LISSEGGKATVTVPQYKDEQSIGIGSEPAKGEEKVVNLKDYPSKVLPLQNGDGEWADMVQLPYLHEVRTWRLACMAPA
jgi:hypothetical protein